MVFHGFWLVSIVFQGSFMVLRDFWLVSMVFKVIFMVFYGFWMVPMVFKVVSCKWHLISQGNPDQGYCFPKINVLSKVSTPKVHQKYEKVSEK